MTDFVAADRPIIDFDHHGPEFSTDPYEFYGRLFDRGCPVAWSEHYDGFWFLGSYEAVRRAAKDDPTFSSARFTDADGAVRGGINIPTLPQASGMVEMDPPEFSEYRRLLNPLFSPGAVNRLRSRIKEITSSRIDAIAGLGECDLLISVTGPIPASVTLEGLGLPTERCARYATVIHEMVSTNRSSPRFPEIMTRVAEMLAEFAQVAKERREDPGSDWVSQLVTAVIHGSPMTDDDVLDHMFLLVAAGVDTTTQLLSHSLLWLSEHPSLRVELREHPERLSVACEEFLRYYTPVQMFARTVQADVVLDGQRLFAGERVMLGWASANRDPAVFERPEQLDITRATNPHMAFGVGVHRCLGSHLARAMFEIVVLEVITRLPDYRIDASRVIYYENRSTVNGITSLPATYTPEARTPHVHP